MRSVVSQVRDLDFKKDQFRENAAREMWEVITVETTGNGQQVLPNPVIFKGPFPDRPSVMYGSDVVRGIGRDSDDLLTVPACSGSSFQFVQNDRGFYVGCHLVVRVESTAPSPLVRHSFVFLGVSYKNIAEGNEGLLTATLSPRTVDL